MDNASEEMSVAGCFVDFACCLVLMRQLFLAGVPNSKHGGAHMVLCVLAFDLLYDSLHHRKKCLAF